MLPNDSIHLVRSWESDHEKRREKLRIQAKLLIAVLVLNGVLGVFSHFYTNATHFENLGTLDTLRQALDATRLSQIHFKTQVQEWKNVLLRGDEAEDFDNYFASFQERERLTQASLADARRLAATLGVANGEIDALIDHHRVLGSAYREGLSLLIPSDPSSHRAVDDHVRGVDRRLMADIDRLADRLYAESRNIHAGIEEASRRRSQLLGWIAFSLVGIGFLLIVLFVANSDAYADRVRER